MTDKPWWEEAFGPGPEPDAKADTDPAKGCGYALLFWIGFAVLFFWWLAVTWSPLDCFIVCP